jgi:geranylgeranyl reductase family protein
MKPSDVIVIGAGPAGATAAHRLASSGARVTLIEKEHFPRDKTCGDGMASEGLKILERTGLGVWARQFPTFDLLRLSSPDGKLLDIPVLAPSGVCFGRTIPRRLLDAELAKAALNAGVVLVEDTTVQDVDIQMKCARVSTDSGAFESQLVILADGSHAPVTRRLGLSTSLPEMIAIRQYLTGDSGPANRLEIHFQQSILPGYNWLFPLQDGRVNAGSFTFTSRTRSKKINLQEELARFKADEGITESRLAHTETDGLPRAHPLRTNFGATRTHTERILVVGDAAEVVSPFSGEGLAPSMRSAELAAEHALLALTNGRFSKEFLSLYTLQLEHEFQQDCRDARILRAALSAPWILNRAFRNMRGDETLALTIGAIVIGLYPPGIALRPRSLMRLLR